MEIDGPDGAGGRMDGCGRVPPLPCYYSQSSDSTSDLGFGMSGDVFDVIGLLRDQPLTYIPQAHRQHNLAGQSPHPKHAAGARKKKHRP